MPDDEDLDLFEIFDAISEAGAPAAPAKVAEAPSVFDGDDDMDFSDLVFEGNDINLAKAWMSHHKFHLVKTADQVRELVDLCLAEGVCALDLETEGFDNRIEYTMEGRPYTRHKIVGYCLGIKGMGYYIPVRHRWEALYRGNPNVDNVEATEAEITRLCRAAQPEVTAEAILVDPFSSRDWVKPPQVVIYFWHSKFDQEFLYPITGIDWWHPESFEDGMLANYVLYTDDDHGLKENAFRKIPPVEGHPYEMIEFKELFPSGMKKDEMKFYNLIPEEGTNGWNAVLYGCSDGICTQLLTGPLVKGVHDRKFDSTYRLEKQVVQVVRILERARILIDKEEIVKLLAEAEHELQFYEEKIIKIAVANGFQGFNPGSSAQLSEFLFGEQGLNLTPKPPQTEEGQYKTDEKTLEAFAEETAHAPEVISWIIKRRQIDKVRGTYLKNLAENTDELNQLRLNFKQTGAATGRFTAPKGDPEHGFGGIPIQGIPARDDPKKPKVAHSLRRVFKSRPGYVLVKADYASQELRIASNVSGERKWIAEYEKEAQTGESADLHFLTAEAFYPGLKKSDPDFKLKRNSGKTANFALIYGGGVGAVQRATGCDKVEGARLKKAFDESVPSFSKWVKRQHKIVKEHKGVKTAFGRFIAIPDAAITADEINESLRTRKKPELPRNEAIKQSKKIQASCERKSTNFPIQGSGADILKISLVMLAKEFHLRGWLKLGGDDSVRMVMTVHDEVVFEIREDRVAEAVPVIVTVMEYPTYLARPVWKVPLVVEPDLGYSWAAKISWHDVVKGTQEPPAYLKGKTIESHPTLRILAKKPESTTPKNSVVLSTVAPPKPEGEAPEVVVPAAAKVPKPQSEPPTSGKLPVNYALFTLDAFRVTPHTVSAVFKAIGESVAEASALNKLNELVPFELHDDHGNVLYSAKEGVLVYPPEFGRRLREATLGPGTFDVYPFMV